MPRATSGPNVVATIGIDISKNGTRRALASRSRKPAWGSENQEHPMPRATSGPNVVATIGIDISKNTFHVIGLDDKGAIICVISCRVAKSMHGAPIFHRA